MEAKHQKGESQRNLNKAETSILKVDPTQEVIQPEPKRQPPTPPADSEEDIKRSVAEWKAASEADLRQKEVRREVQEVLQRVQEVLQRVQEEHQAHQTDQGSTQ